MLLTELLKAAKVPLDIAVEQAEIATEITIFIKPCRAMKSSKHRPLASAEEYSLLHATVGLTGRDIRYPLACNENMLYFQNKNFS